MAEPDAIAAAVAAAEKALMAKVVRLMRERPYADPRDLVPDLEALLTPEEGGK